MAKRRKTLGSSVATHEANAERSMRYAQRSIRDGNRKLDVGDCRAAVGHTLAANAFLVTAGAEWINGPGGGTERVPSVMVNGESTNKINNDYFALRDDLVKKCVRPKPEGLGRARKRS